MRFFNLLKIIPRGRDFGKQSKYEIILIFNKEDYYVQST